MAHFLFDLDGTLADSEAGIIASFKAGLAAAQAPAMADAELRPFLGTPLPLFFGAAAPDIDAAGIAAGIASFRAYFAETGILQNRLYPGVKSMLQHLRYEGASAWIVTSKPQQQAIQVKDLLGIGALIDVRCSAGADADAGGSPL